VWNNIVLKKLVLILHRTLLRNKGNTSPHRGLLCDQELGFSFEYKLWLVKNATIWENWTLDSQDCRKTSFSDLNSPDHENSNKLAYLQDKISNTQAQWTKWEQASARQSIFHHFTSIGSVVSLRTQLGRICLDILKDKWSPALHIRTVLLRFVLRI
jgi:hypothetical protein